VSDKYRNVQNWIEYSLFRVLLAILRIIPYQISQSIAIALFLMIGYGIGIRRKLAYAQLRKIYPEKSRKQLNTILLKLYKNMALSICEIYLLKDRALISNSRVEGMENVQEAFSLGRGIILATFHFGNWEAARVLPRFGIPLSVVVKKQRNRLFNNYTNQIRTRQGVKIIDMKRGLRDITKYLNQNEMVAILTDQNSGDKGLITNFLGYPAFHWKGAAKLSLRMKVPVIVGLCLRDERSRAVFKFDRMIYHPELEDNDNNILMLIEEINAIQESYIHAYPHLWFWVHRRWRGSYEML